MTAQELKKALTYEKDCKKKALRKFFQDIGKEFNGDLDHLVSDINLVLANMKDNYEFIQHRNLRRLIYDFFEWLCVEVAEKELQKTKRR